VVYDFISSVFQAFLLLLIIMGPITGLPVFLKITEHFDRKRSIASANRAITFALVLLIFFVFVGKGLLDFFNISFDGFRIAGGIVLLLLGIEYMFHVHFAEKRSTRYSTDILVPFAMPLIIGPGVISQTILLTGSGGYLSTLIGGLLALGIYWLVLHYAHIIAARIGEQGIEVITRFMGLLLMAIAVDMIHGGIAGFIGG
jgi:multiple antibiotic resistance protein